jgi:alpha-tubulin suppressor-like RCC1 family protein
MNKIKASQLLFSKENHPFPNLKLELFLGDHSCVVSSNEGHIWVWGKNNNQKLAFWDDPIHLPQMVDKFDFEKGEYLMNVTIQPLNLLFLTNRGSLVVSGVNHTQNLHSRIEGNFELNENEKISNINDYADDHHFLALTNQGRIFLGNLAYKKRAAEDQTPKLNLNDDDKITHFAQFKKTINLYNINYELLFVINNENIISLHEDKKTSLNNNFMIKSKLRVKLLLSLNGTCLLLTEDNELFYWGLDLFDKEKVVKKPLLVSFGSKNDKITSIKLSNQFLIALTENNRLLFFGIDEDKVLVPNQDSSEHKVPMDITDMIKLKSKEKILKIACGLSNIAVITSLNRVLVWGKNDYGTLGNGTTERALHPYEISLPYIP